MATQRPPGATGAKRPSGTRAAQPRPARSPRRQLPPSRVPRLLLWGLLLVLLAVLANAVLHMTY
ncbi:hypothetical protein P3W85_00220 [Cupriavidus basilensis]|uniref:Uncharacterized protein n=1 Tax=Cupriavidus basilensis TaxID=68895 RepID=A0ABT6AFL5_9BURK|nr:hypothetical protein [Cupriavidus basilensis]MDF3831393.1 hypothetical protein [Cupriavidus basilensis]